MKDVDEAVDAIAAMFELEGGAFDDDGRLEIVADADLLLEVVRLDPHTIALECPVESAAANPARESLIAYLTANYLGDGTGAAGLAFAPDGQPLLAQRVDIRPLDAAALEAEIETFLAYRAFWRSDLAAGAVAPPPPAAAIDLGSLVFRV